MRCPDCDMVLAGQPKFCAECGARLGPVSAPAVVRRTVTVVFCDLTGSTSLGDRHDPEALRAVLTRYFSAMSGVLESHGGSVEKFIGDAVMAVFGVPQVHEDDALRAVRAAWEMQTALAELGSELSERYALAVAARIGVNTGEVVVGDGAHGTVATGDAVNVAARLEQAANPGEVLVGEATWRLVRGAAPAAPVAPLTLKGKPGPVPAWRLTGVPAPPAQVSRPGSGLSAGLVGRERELRLLGQALNRASVERTCQLVTVLGAAGVGKTRLLEEFHGDLPPGVRVLSGRCLSYGEGVVFFPLLQILRGAAGLTGGESEEQGRRRLAALLDGVPEPTPVVERLAPLAGLAGTAPAPEDLHWALRVLVEAVARQHPVVMIVDDIHWAQPALLTVLEYLTDWLRDAPVLLVTMARPELLDTRPDWGGERPNATTALLEPLDPGDTAELVTRLLDDADLEPATLARISAAADGMPLFAEQLLAMLIDDGRLVLDSGRSGDRTVDLRGVGDGRRRGLWRLVGDLSHVRVPPSIGALLAARLDRLTGEQRTVIEAASVVGQVSYVGAVTELVASLPAEEVHRHLHALVCKDLVRPTDSDMLGEDAIRFRHILVREAAYAGLSKARRAEAHEILARWLDERAEAMAGDADQFVGYHLEQAVGLRRDLGPLDPTGVDLAHAAAGRLATAARHLERADLTTAGILLERAARLVGEQSPAWPPLQLRRATLLAYEWRTAEAADAARRLAEVAEAHGDRRWQAIARAAWILHGIDAAYLKVSDEDMAFLDAALAEFLADHDPYGVLQVATAKGAVLWNRADVEGGLQMLELRAPAADQLDDELASEQIAINLATSALLGPMPLAEALPRVSAILEQESERASNTAALTLAAVHAVLLAYDDRPEEARCAVEAYMRQAEERRTPTVRALNGAFVVEALDTVGDRAAAEGLAERCVQHLMDVGGFEGHLSTLAPLLGELCYRGADHAAAARWAEHGRELAADDDPDAQARWRALSAKLGALSGQAEAAIGLADQAVEQALRGGEIVLQAQCHADRAEVLQRTGRAREAEAELRRALDCYQRKGHRPGMRWMRARLRGLQPPSADQAPSTDR